MKMFHGIIDNIVNHPRKCMLASVLFCLACISGVRLLGTDFTYRAFFNEGNPLREEVENFERQFSNDDSIVILIKSPSGIFDKESAELVLNLTEDMWKVPEVIRVDSVSNYRWVHADQDDLVVEPLLNEDLLTNEKALQERLGIALNDEIIPDYLLSPDGTTTMVVGYVRNALEQAVDSEPVVSAVREMVEKYQGGDHEMHITGRLAVMQAMKESSQSDTKSRLPFVLLTILLVLALRFKHAGGVIPMIPLIVLSVVSTMGLAGWLGIKISNITAVVPQFIIAICVADGVHLLSSYFKLRKAGFEKKHAARISLRENFVPTILTSVTTSIAFFSFLSSSVAAISNLGIMVGLGTLIAWLVSYFFLGGIMSILPQKQREQFKTEQEVEQFTESAVANSPLINRYITTIARYPYQIAAVFIFLTVFSTWIASTNTINANPFRYFAEGYWLREANTFSEQNLRGSQGIEVVINSNQKDGIKNPVFLSQVEDFQTWIDSVSGVVRTFSIVDIVKQSNRSLNGDKQEFYTLPDRQEAIAELIFLYSLNLPQGLELSNRVSLNNDALRISIKWTNYDSATATALADKIQEKGQSMGLDVSTTGKMLLFQRMNEYVASSFVITLLITVCAISALLVLAFRSIHLGWISLITNAFPLCFGMAVLKFSGNHIDIGAVVVLSVCLGVAIDDTIHFVSHIQNGLKAGKPVRKVISTTLYQVTPAISITTIILVVAFGSFITANFVPNKNFGVMSVAILSTAWLTNVVLLPAIFFILEKINSGQHVETSTNTIKNPEAYDLGK